MRVKLTIDSATEAEMRAILLAYHQTKDRYATPPLVLDGCVVKVEGPRCYGVTTPMIEPERAAEITFAIAGTPWPTPSVAFEDDTSAFPSTFTFEEAP